MTIICSSRRSSIATRLVGLAIAYCWLADATRHAASTAEPPQSQPTERSGAESAPSGEDEAETQRFFARWRKSTFGGIELWNDELIFRAWRIQRHALAGHCRLLDGDDRRVTWGAYETCLKELEHIKAERKLAPISGRVVIVLHGLAGWRSTMNPLCEYLEKHGLTTINVSYASTRGSVEEHAQTLAKIIAELDGVEQIDFAAHSLGNLIIRKYLSTSGSADEQHVPDPRVKRFVMLAPTNHGATRANDFADRELFSLALGEAAMQLGPKWNELEKQLTPLTCEFGIIAGGRSDGKGYSSRLPGDDDFVLTVESTKLDGARDFIVVPVLHPFNMNDAKVQEYTVRFLQEGYFIAADKRHPLPDSGAPEKSDK